MACLRTVASFAADGTVGGRLPDAGGERLSSNPLWVEVTRGVEVESVHRVHGFVCGAGGDEEAALGDRGLRTFWRSGMKPFQALPLIEDGAATAFAFEFPDLALCCGSHGGMPQHTERVSAILGRIGCAEEDLRCGPHVPFDAETARALACRGQDPGRLHNNCSGKHALMLALARHRGWPLAGYELLDHPVQERIRGCLADWIELDPEALGWAVDGCGVPTPHLPLAWMARAYSRLVVRARSGDEPAAQVVTAMTAHAELTSSPGRAPLALMEATRGRLLAKEGAEGLLCVAAVDDGWGLALKVEDGGMRGVGPAVVELMASTGVLRPGERDALEAVRRVPIVNTLGSQVGEVTARRSADPAGRDGT